MIRAHVLRIDLCMTLPACLHHERLPLHQRHRREPDDTVCRVAIDTCGIVRLPRTRTTVRTLAVPDKLLVTVTGRAVDRLDVPGMGKIGRIEVLMTVNARQPSMCRRPEFGRVHKKGNCLSPLRHARRSVLMTHQTIPVRLRRQNGRDEQREKNEGNERWSQTFVMHHHQRKLSVNKSLFRGTLGSIPVPTNADRIC